MDRLAGVRLTGLLLLAGMEAWAAGQLPLFFVPNQGQARADMLDYLLSTDAAERETLRAEMVAYDAALMDLIQRMDEADTDREDIETLAGIDSAWHAYTAWRDQALAAMEAGDRANALASYHNQGRRLAAEVDRERRQNVPHADRVAPTDRAHHANE